MRNKHRLAQTLQGVTESQKEGFMEGDRLSVDLALFCFGCVWNTLVKYQLGWEADCQETLHHCADMREHGCCSWRLKSTT